MLQLPLSVHVACLPPRSGLRGGEGIALPPTETVGLAITADNNRFARSSKGMAQRGTVARNQGFDLDGCITRTGKSGHSDVLVIPSHEPFPAPAAVGEDETRRLRTKNNTTGYRSREQEGGGETRETGGRPGRTEHQGATQTRARRTRAACGQPMTGYSSSRRVSHACPCRSCLAIQRLDALGT